MTEETPARKPRRSAKEIAQAHADAALKALEKHDEKVAKADEKLAKARDEREALVGKRQELVREADYRAAHPLLQDDDEWTEADRADVERDAAEDRKQDDDQPF